MDWARTEHSVKGALFAIDFAPDNGLVELSFHNDRSVELYVFGLLLPVENSVLNLVRKTYHL